MEPHSKRRDSQKATVPKKQPSPNRGITVHNTAELERVDPIDLDHTAASVASVGGYTYMPFLGQSDNFFTLFLNTRLASPTQHSCIQDKTLYAAGAGLQVRDQEFPSDFDKKINTKRQTLDDVLSLAFNAFFQDGNVFFEIVRTEFLGIRHVHVYIHNNLDCRFETNKSGGDPTHVLRSKEFRRNNMYAATDQAIRIPLWTDMAYSEDQVWARDEGNPNVQRTMIHVKDDWGNFDAYGLPSNFPGFQNVFLEYRTTGFNVDNLNNNMFLGGALVLEGNVSQAEEKKLTNSLKKMHTGAGKGMRILALSAEGGLTGSKFLPFTQNHDGHFKELDERNEEKIIGVNQWSKEIMDLKNQSGLGKGGDYLNEIITKKFTTIIKPVQERMQNSFVFPLMQIIDEWKGTRFYDLPWHIKSSLPISYRGQLDINSLLSVDQGLEEIGKAPIGGELGSMRISQVKGPVQKEGGSNAQS